MPTGSVQDFCRVSLLLMRWWVPWSLPLSSALWTRTFTVPGWTILRTRRLALAQQATQTVVFLQQLHLVALLIAESWLEWCEQRLAAWTEWVYELRDKERKRGMKQGSRSWSVIRNWTAPSCLCSAPAGMSKQIQGRTFYQPFLVRIHFYSAYFQTLVVPESCNLYIGNANRMPWLPLLKSCTGKPWFERRTFDLAHLSCLFVVVFNNKLEPFIDVKLHAGQHNHSADLRLIMIHGRLHQVSNDGDTPHFSFCIFITVKPEQRQACSVCFDEKLLWNHGSNAIRL